ncbi:MAG TPA: UDP-N-acetylglucosamine 1-carboxyvinyltransferase [Candidatus Saccharimonadales bacterium]|nr:UDP-N-acetylglucosamine 1-carboxyvinyltransferase [Candidatus Saccharimonadales bacterium]
MSDTNHKIGELIAQIRQERGFTQAEFAKRLNTSQSAVNRIEHGRQNLSLETLGRISDVLNKSLINLNEGAINLRIEGGHELHGSIPLKTSKNAAVALLCASLLNHGVTRFKAFPRIEEVYRIIEVLESIGVQVKWLSGNDIEIRRPAKLRLDKLDAAAARKTRSVLMLIGPLMHDYKDFQIPYAGGCELGRRTVEPHLFALEEFGVDIAAHTGNYQVTVNKKAPGEMVLYEAGNTVTNNVLMAAARTTETTFVQAASGDYMVQDLCYFLQKLGVEIEGIGTPFLKIRGVQNIKKNVTFAPSEDPIEAMFFISAAVTTNSKITIERVPYKWIGLELLKLKKMGVEYNMSKPYKAANGKTDLADLTVEKHQGELKALNEKLHPNLYPGLNPDNLPYFVPIAAVARGRTLIHDWMYENRALYYTEMTKVGAQVELADPHRIYIVGPTKFKRADVVCPPALRPASLLLIGMLAAKGTSILRNVYTINRGYEDLAARLNSLGASITVLHEI